MLYLGIDQHRKQLTVEDRNENGDRTVRRQVSTRWGSVRTFLQEYSQRAMPEGGFVVVVEGCGFNRWLVKLLAAYGCRQVTVLRQRLGQLRTRTINRIKHLLRKHNLEQECPTKGLDTLRGRKWLAQVTLEAVDRVEMDLLLAQWNLWDEQIEKIAQEIGKRQAEHPTAVVLATIPGCGAYSSLALACRIGSIERFPRPGSLANYWGLTPGCRNSGEVTDRLGAITKQGSAVARFILGQLVLHILRRDAWMRAWYGRIKRRRGSKIARVAVMRRLATILWHMLKYQQPYVIGGPPRKKLPREGE